MTPAELEEQLKKMRKQKNTADMSPEELQVMLNEMRKKPSSGGSALKEAGVKAAAFGRGAAQGLTFGFSDEITGGAVAVADVIRDFYNTGNLSAAQQKFGEYYVKRRDESRERLAQSEKEAPITALAGEIAGSIAMPVPGLGVARGAAVVGKAGSKLIGKKAATEAVEAGAKDVAISAGSMATRGAAEAGATAIGKQEEGVDLGTATQAAAFGGVFGGVLGGGSTALKRLWNSSPITSVLYSADKFSKEKQKAMESLTRKDVKDIPSADLRRLFKKQDAAGDFSKKSSEIEQNVIEKADFSVFNPDELLITKQMIQNNIDKIKKLPKSIRTEENIKRVKELKDLQSTQKQIDDFIKEESKKGEQYSANIKRADEIAKAFKTIANPKLDVTSGDIAGIAAETAVFGQPTFSLLRLVSGNLQRNPLLTGKTDYYLSKYGAKIGNQLNRTVSVVGKQIGENIAKQEDKLKRYNGLAEVLDDSKQQIARLENNHNWQTMPQEESDKAYAETPVGGGYKASDIFEKAVYVGQLSDKGFDKVDDAMKTWLNQLSKLKQGDKNRLKIQDAITTNLMRKLKKLEEEV